MLQKSPFWLSLGLVLLLSACASRSTPPLANTSVGKPLKTPSKPSTISVPNAPIENSNTPRSQLGDAFVVAAKQYLGLPYKWGGTSPSEGFDCSGLIHYTALNALNVKLPRSTEPLAAEGSPIGIENLAPGDLVFFNTLGRPNSHVGIYTGANKFLHAPSSGGVVREDSLSNRYWQSRFTQSRRLFSDVIASAANKAVAPEIQKLQPANPALESTAYYLSVLEN